MPSFELIGTLRVKNDTQQVSEKFSKREFVLTTDTQTQYPQLISFQLTQDKCSLLDQYQVGEEMKVHFNLRGREWSGPQGVKYFNSLEAWRLEKAGNNSASVQPQVSHQSSNVGVDIMPSSEIADDLPF
ncbi:MAG: DUF3127 domain-containing protein [Chitinophagaceae bacterium]|nr:DUF3127 domain-containing protein [Chitinophagaceae bacterium]